MNENLNEKSKVVSVKKVLKVLLLLTILFVFCPSFLVSCSGISAGSDSTMKVSAMTAINGISYSGQQIVKPHPIMLLCLFLPIGMLAVLFIKNLKLTEKNKTNIILGCSALDFLIWIIFASKVNELAKENFCTSKPTIWFILNLISLGIVILLTTLVTLNKLQMDCDLIATYTKGNTQDTLNQLVDATNKMANSITKIAKETTESLKPTTNNPSQDIIGYCSKCGKPIKYGCKYCISCGTQVPESMIAEAEKTRMSNATETSDGEEIKNVDEQEN